MTDRKPGYFLPNISESYTIWLTERVRKSIFLQKRTLRSGRDILIRFFCQNRTLETVFCMRKQTKRAIPHFFHTVYTLNWPGYCPIPPAGHPGPGIVYDLPEMVVHGILICEKGTLPRTSSSSGKRPLFFLVNQAEFSLQRSMVSAASGTVICESQECGDCVRAEVQYLGYGQPVLLDPVDIVNILCDFC